MVVVVVILVGMGRKKGRKEGTKYFGSVVGRDGANVSRIAL